MPNFKSCVRQNKQFVPNSQPSLCFIFERFELIDLDELSYFAGVLNYALQRNADIIILHEVSLQTIDTLRDLFDIEIYTLFVGGNTRKEYDIFIQSDDKLEENLQQTFDKLI